MYDDASTAPNNWPTGDVIIPGQVWDSLKSASKYTRIRRFQTKNGQKFLWSD